MKVLITGDRKWANKALIYDFLDSHSEITQVIEGEAAGADSLGRICAEELGIPVKKFPANWAKYGRAAGPIRNQQMLDEGRPDMVVAFHNDIEKSKGTKDMVARARKRAIPVKIISELKD